MVHSPISVHSETRAHSTSHSIRGGTNNTRLSPYYWPMGPVLSAEDIDHGPSFLPCALARCYARGSPGDPTFTCLPVRSAD